MRYILYIFKNRRILEDTVRKIRQGLIDHTGVITFYYNRDRIVSEQTTFVFKTIEDAKRGSLRGHILHKVYSPREVESEHTDLLHYILYPAMTLNGVNITFY